MHLTSPSSSIYVAGHRGLVGSAVVRRLRGEGFDDLLLRTSAELDLRDQAATAAFFIEQKPDFVVVAAARVGGIVANDRYPADFISDNLAIQTNVIRAAHKTGVKRLIFLGSSCIYPKHAPQPMREDHLLTGPLEPTNQWYAIAKIAGTKLCEAHHRQHGDDFITLMPTNLYGPNDNFDLETSHVLPALIRKFHESRPTVGAPASSSDTSAGASASPSDQPTDPDDAPVTLWGTGTPRREFLHADDLADAVLFTLRTPEQDLHGAAEHGMLNVGVGKDISIAELAELIREVVGSRAEIRYDRSKPDGTPRKLLDVSRMSGLGWTAQIPLEEGIRRTYEWYLESESHALAE